MMDSDASSDEEYGPTELDQMIQDEFFNSSHSDEEVDMIMQEEMDRQVEHILNFKGSIKGRRVINLDRGVEARDDYFKLRRDCCGELSFSPKQKCTAALRMLALGTAADTVGAMVRMGESTCLKTTVKFTRAVVEVFGPEYLREPNAQDTEKLLAIGEEALQWGITPCNYTVGDQDYNMGYYLADGIYPQWAAFVKTISEPRGNKQSHFATMQEAARKDVERAFGVLQTRWGIVQNAAMMWESETL
ncbi:uncharacterized protein [Aegilops tauschii subsp. strangulata]|uniref:uncharacterized protein n=1 Tax=Aegilops tauschii subsp. strangulata TaxID=200361 RepID=UPI00098A7559|nr:uncharacterized protein LOC109736111 [Aegilops tauschii subsp. strangulata]